MITTLAAPLWYTVVFFFQHLTKPSRESTRSCMMFLSINLSLQHSWVSQREQLTFWFPTQPAACNPRLPKSEEYKTLASPLPPLISFSNLSPLCSSHIQNNQENFLTPLWQAAWKQLPQYFFIIVFRANGKADLKKKTTQTQTKLGKKKSSTYLPHARHVQRVWESTWKGKIIFLSNRIRLENILRTVSSPNIYSHYLHTHMCLYVHILYTYTNNFKHIRAGCCSKFHVRARKWEVKLTPCSKSTGTAYSFNSFSILLLSFFIKPSSWSSGSLCNSSVDEFAFVISHSYGNWFSNEVNTWGLVLCCSIVYILILQQCEVVVKWCLTNW